MFDAESKVLGALFELLENDLYVLVDVEAALVDVSDVDDKSDDREEVDLVLSADDIDELFVYIAVAALLSNGSVSCWSQRITYH